jgi:Tol biopolymer transport system component
VSIASAGGQADNSSNYAAMSADGRYVAFTSVAANLVAGDTNGTSDVFVRDRQTGTTERVSIDSAGAEGTNYSDDPAISADGRYVAFGSTADNLVAGDTNGSDDAFVRDRQTGTTERVSIDSAGVQGNDYTGDVVISADGRYVGFYSYADNLVAGDTNGTADVYVHDRQTGTTELASLNGAGAQGPTESTEPALSADGRYVAFTSHSDNLVAGDTNATGDVYVRDRQTGTTERVNLDSNGVQSIGNDSSEPAISADGRYVTFSSSAENLVAGDTNMSRDIFVRDSVAGVTERVSSDSAGSQGDHSSSNSAISADGRHIAFTSSADNLVDDDTNGTSEVFVRDLQTRTTERVTIDSAGAQGNGGSSESALSADGRYIAFASSADNLVTGDTNGVADVFVRDRGAMVAPPLPVDDPETLPATGRPHLKLVGNAGRTSSRVRIGCGDAAACTIRLTGIRELAAKTGRPDGKTESKRSADRSLKLAAGERKLVGVKYTKYLARTIKRALAAGNPVAPKLRITAKQAGHGFRTIGIRVGA